MNIQDVRCFLLDMDGTFYLGEKIIPGSLEFIRRVEETGRDFLFLTNNSSHNAAFYVQRLKRMGLTIGREKVLTSGEATAAVVKEMYPGKRAFVLGNEFLIEEMREAGVPVDMQNPEIVVVGYDTTLDYRKMTAVCDFVRAGLPYIATHPDFNCPTETGFAPDLGAIMAFIEASTGRRADRVVGKPHTGIVQAALRRTGLSAGQMAMVGDRLYTDIETGLKSGMLSILVLSGETTPQMLAEYPNKPDLVFDRLADMIPLL
ncbi:MAG TPA: HAD-IIA family hydrolase [Candidatus Pullichristensenella stercorigallinarum]|uniref:Acid sugar phosphatase n=1 Tax=Candidatus Pullichristensenella stercorigallinarum TaxID=2840909 RepID=A0A9D1CVM9_9FIRM|nr:HAD-IIA family hydrolase [Candidatus Pullichristensenella stercorigallinarum]